MVDIQSITWQTITKKLHAEQEEAINSLILDRQSERQRGKIDLISRLLELSDPQKNPVVINDDYK
jgi:hypothetical protein